MPTSPDANLHRQIKARLLALQPRAFELFTGDLLEFMGLRNVSVTRYSGDGGIDATGTWEMSDALITIPTAVQVKRYRTNVQRADIDRFIGALSGRYAQGMFITTAGYTPNAARKAATGVPRIATVSGDQVVGLMMQHRLGISEHAGVASSIDEEYFYQFEAVTTVRPGQINEHSEGYHVVQAAQNERQARPEDDLISLRALSHALRVDTSALRRWMEKGQLQPDQTSRSARNGYFFRRDRIEHIRATLVGKARPANAQEWRQAFLTFARSRTMSKSYKPVLLKVLIRIVDRNGEAPMSALVQGFRAFYLARRRAEFVVEFGPPDISDALLVSDAHLRQLIIKHPLERFLIQGLLEYLPTEGIVRFAPQVWAELRYWELLDIEESANAQIEYYYNRSR